MGIPKRQKPIKLLNLEALLRRLPDTESTEYIYYKDQYKIQKKGYDEEVCVDLLWNEIKIPSPYHFFHSYETINTSGYSHQIDTILLTPYFIWLIEIKNISGRLDIDESKHQLIRTNQEGVIESFRNPVNQIKRHGEYISTKLKDLKINLPVELSIIIVSDYTIIGAIPKGHSIFHASGLQTEFENLFNKHQNREIASHQYTNLKAELMNQLKRKEWKAKVDPTTLQKGVLCRSCQYKSVMIFEYGSFKCVRCGKKSRDAHLEALSDYRYLISEWISNEELRRFLGIESRHAVKRIVQKLNLQQVGNSRNRKYRIPDFFEREDNEM